MNHPGLHHRPQPQALQPHELPEVTAYVRSIYVDGNPAQTDPDEPTFCKAAFGSQYSFDVLLNIVGGGSTVAEKVPFSNPVPTKYKVQVRLGERVFVNRTGRLLEFSIPWVPYVKPCSTTPGAAAGRSGRRVIVPSGTAVPDTGGGTGTGTQGSGTAGGSGNGSGSPHGGGSVPP